MQFPYLTPRDHPIVQRQLKGWQRYTGILRGLFIAAMLLGLLMVAAMAVMIAIALLDNSNSWLLLDDLWPLMATPWAMNLLWGGLKFIALWLGSLGIAGEAEDRTAEVLTLTHLTPRDIVRAKFSAGAYQLWRAVVVFAALDVLLRLMGLVDLRFGFSASLTSAALDLVLGISLGLLRHASDVLFNLALGLLASTFARTRARALITAAAAFGVVAVVSLCSDGYLAMMTGVFSGMPVVDPAFQAIALVVGLFAAGIKIIRLAAVIVVVVVLLNTAALRLKENAAPIF